MFGFYLIHILVPSTLAALLYLMIVAAQSMSLTLTPAHHLLRESGNSKIKSMSLATKRAVSQIPRRTLRIRTWRFVIISMIYLIYTVHKL